MAYWRFALYEKPPAIFCVVVLLSGNVKKTKTCNGNEFLRNTPQLIVANEEHWGYIHCYHAAREVQKKLLLYSVIPKYTMGALVLDLFDIFGACDKIFKNFPLSQLAFNTCEINWLQSAMLKLHSLFLVFFFNSNMFTGNRFKTLDWIRLTKSWNIIK